MLHHLTLPLLLGLGASPAAPPAAHGASRTAALEGYEELVAAYDAALTEWDATFKATTDLRERAALRKSHPAITHWERFRALGDGADGSGGDGRAYLWMIEQAGDAGLKRAERAAAKTELYDALFARHAGAPWFADVVRRLPRDVHDVGAESAEAHLGSLLEVEDTTVSGLATLTLGTILADADDAERQARGKELLKSYEKKFVSVGAVAIDFTGRTFEGHEFKLSDYRGKVVLVDFYGFW